MRRHEPLDPAVEAELAALDAALAGAPDADAELAALVRDVRAVAPRQSDLARAHLDAHVAGLTTTPRKRRAPSRSWTPGRWLLAPLIGAVAAALVVLAVVVTPLGGGDSATPQSAAGAGAAADNSERAVSAGGGALPPGTTVTAVPAPAAPGRRVERTVSLELGARADRFDAVTDGVVQATQRAGGFVADSRIRREDGRGTATFVLRIPTARLDGAIADLSRLAHVRAIEQSATDLTGATDGTAARLRDAQISRRALVAALATASGARAARLRARLAHVRARERSLDRALRALRARTTDATVDLTVTSARSAGGTPAAKGRWTPADAWREARRVLEVAAGVLILILAVALPIALVGGLGAVATGAVRRRRREAALDVV